MNHGVWVDIPGYEGFYKVSQDGRIQSQPRLGARLKELCPEIDRDGYKRVILSKNGKKRKQLVHRLVMLAFVGECPEGMQVCHYNGDPADNRIENLRYGTPKENMRDRDRHGRTHHSRGEKSGTAKTTLAVVNEIRERYGKGGVMQKDLAEEYGLSKMAVSRIVRYHSWNMAG